MEVDSKPGIDDDKLNRLQAIHEFMDITAASLCHGGKHFFAKQSLYPLNRNYTFLFEK